MNILEKANFMPGGAGGSGKCSRVVRIPDGAEMPPGCIETSDPVRPWSFDAPEAIAAVHAAPTAPVTSAVSEPTTPAQVAN